MNLVIDLNTLISAATLKNPNTDEIDPCASRILMSVIECKHKIFVTKQIAIVYSEYVKSLKHGSKDMYGVNIGNILTKALSMGKVEIKGLSEQNFKKIPRDDEVSSEDRKFARLAYHSGAILVTYDGPLREILGNRSKLPDQICQGFH